MPESPNGRDPLRGSPWWMRAIAYVGLPAAFGGAAFFGFYAAFVTMSTAPQDNKTMLQQMGPANAVHDQVTRENFSQLRQQGETQIRLLRSICQSVAKTDLQRNECGR